MALGDSFTEGLEDHAPHHEKLYRGWADFLALALDQRRAEQGLPSLRYANLAVRGRLLRPILGEQLPVAVAKAPDLVSLVGGGNDILRPVVDVDELARNLDAAVARLRAAGAAVLLATSVDPQDSPIIRRTRGRVAAYNAYLWSIARRRGAYVIDQWGMRSLRDWRMWAPDRIHLTTEGHARVAQAGLAALGLTPDSDAWDEPEPTPAPTFTAQDHVSWISDHAFPWATRRLRRASSGDERHAKYPEFIEVRTELQ